MIKDIVSSSLLNNFHIRSYLLTIKCHSLTSQRTRVKQEGIGNFRERERGGKRRGRGEGKRGRERERKKETKGDPKGTNTEELHQNCCLSLQITGVMNLRVS